MIKVHFNRFYNNKQLDNRLRKIEKDGGKIKSVRVVTEDGFMEGDEKSYGGSFTVEIIYEIN